MGKQFNFSEAILASPNSEPAVFDRNILMHHAMGDASLATEVLALFEAQLSRLEGLDWTHLDLAFEMHTLRGAAAAVGAIQLQDIAERWRAGGSGFEATLTAAIKSFRAKVLN